MLPKAEGMIGSPDAMPDHFDPDPNVRALLDRITRYYPKGIDPDLTRTRRLMNDLGNPHLRLPPIIHVAGTNGKGSTIAYLRAIAEHAGMTCHVMTSPHLVQFNERFVVASKQIDNDQLIEAFSYVEHINQGQDITAFELITTVGFYLFSQHKADMTLLEVGMGGRLDATNIILSPTVSVINVISRDHTKFLGETYTEIAAEKAGIIKPNCPVVISPQIYPEVMPVFENIAQNHNAPISMYGQDWSFDVLPSQILLHSEHDVWPLPYPNLVGDHQFGNAVTAAVAMQIFENRTGLKIPTSSYEYGLTHAHWPGRLQKLSHGPLIDLLQKNQLNDWEIWIDGGHNDSCGQVLAQQIEKWAHTNKAPVHIILGMITTKEPTEFTTPILPLVETVHTIAIPDQPLTYSAQDLAAKINSAQNLMNHLPAEASEDVYQAINHIIESYRLNPTSPTPQKILITGSLYLMGHILRACS